MKFLCQSLGATVESLLCVVTEPPSSWRIKTKQVRARGAVSHLQRRSSGVGHGFHHRGARDSATVIWGSFLLPLSLAQLPPSASSWKLQLISRQLSHWHKKRTPLSSSVLASPRLSLIGPAGVPESDTKGGETTQCLSWPGSWVTHLLLEAGGVHPTQWT